MFPALWFYSMPGKNPDRPRAEIDLVEFLGRSDIFSTTIYPGRAADNKGVHVGQAPGLIDGKFHTYGMDWTADHIDFYLDQQKLYSAPTWLAAAYRGVSLGPMMDYVVDAKWMTSNPHLRADPDHPESAEDERQLPQALFRQAVLERPAMILSRHCERSEAIQLSVIRVLSRRHASLRHGLLRFARNGDCA